MAGSTARRWLRWVVLVLTTAVALSSWGGFAYLVWGPAAEQIPVSPPDFLPGQGWAAGGFALAALVALPSTVAMVLLIGDAPLAGRATLLSGVLLLGWITAQVLLIGLVSGLQPAMLGVGLALAGGGLALARLPVAVGTP